MCRSDRPNDEPPHRASAELVRNFRVLHGLRARRLGRFATCDETADTCTHAETPKDKVGTSDGITKAQLKTGVAAKTKVKISAQGTSLVLPLAATGSTFFDASNVVVQLVNSDGACWTSEFTPGDMKTNAVDSFKAQTK